MGSRRSIHYRAEQVAPRGNGGYRGVELQDANGEQDADGKTGDAAARSLRRRRICKQMPLWQELPLLLLVAFGLAVLIRSFLLQAFYIPSGSMEHTLMIGDRVLVNKVVYDIRQPQRGEAVVFRGTDNWAPEAQVSQTGFFGKIGRTLGGLVGVGQPSEKDFIKRIIGLPGDVVSCCDAQGRVMVNGQPLDEPYVTENSPLGEDPVQSRCGPRKFGPITVAPGNMWVMGDHRLVSQDSRCQGQVPIKNIIGKAFVIVWPQDHWSTLGVPPTFRHVPRPFSTAAEQPVPVHDAVGVIPVVPPLATASKQARKRLARPNRRASGSCGGAEDVGSACD
jgi:signal peptidase I